MSDTNGASTTNDSLVFIINSNKSPNWRNTPMYSFKDNEGGGGRGGAIRDKSCLWFTAQSLNRQMWQVGKVTVSTCATYWTLRCQNVADWASLTVWIYFQPQLEVFGWRFCDDDDDIAVTKITKIIIWTMTSLSSLRHDWHDWEHVMLVDKTVSYDELWCWRG